jgi:hypothetical protein
MDLPCQAPVFVFLIHSEDSPGCKARQIKRETAQLQLDGFKV